MEREGPDAASAGPLTKRRPGYFFSAVLQASLPGWPLVAQLPLPLQSFLPLDSPQPPLPLQEFWPLQACLSFLLLLSAFVPGSAFLVLSFLVCSCASGLCPARNPVSAAPVSSPRTAFVTGRSLFL